MTRAAALDSFDLGVGLCHEASIDESRCGTRWSWRSTGTEAALIRDFVVRRREPDGGFVWRVPSSFLDDEELTPDAPARSPLREVARRSLSGGSAVGRPVSRSTARPRLPQAIAT